MKLNTKFVLATFFIVLLISISSMLVFYILSGKVIKQQQEKTILNATTNFAFALQYELQNMDEEFNSLLPQIKNSPFISLEKNKIDFLFTLENDSTINKKEFWIKPNSFLSRRTYSFVKFFQNNPTLLLRYKQLNNGKTFFYGKIIDSEFLNSIAQKINADVSLVLNESPVEISKPAENKKYLLKIINANKILQLKNNFDLYSEEESDQDFISSIYSSKSGLFPFSKVNFLIFQSFKESSEFRSTLRIVMLLIIITGSGITFIIVLLFTNRLRKQISLLNEVVVETGKGNLDLRVPILTKDEIGKFGESFNKMLDEIVKKNTREKNYSEFITLINQKQSLQDLCDAALSKIINSVQVPFGCINLVEGKNVKQVSTFGLVNNKFRNDSKDEIYTLIINKKEKLEYYFEENFPEVKTAITSIKIKYLLLFPIIYNKEVIAIVELASDILKNNISKEYLEVIHDQLAIGIINAKSFEQLEKLVEELQKLNEESKKQNSQIIQQNEQLIKLHKELQEKAEELDKQRKQAIELTKVKSEFLASMSHELRTPLISINGLTELLLKNISLDSQLKDRIKIVHRNGKKLLSLINNILEFSKFESGKIEVKKETFLLADLIEDLFPLFEQLTKEKDLKLIFDLPKGKSLLLNTDKEKIEQILSNLITNAIKFTESGYVKLNVEIVHNDEIKFCVEDSGIGISENDKEIIFKEFKQADSSLARKYSGAGLGLAICKKYLELLGCDLFLESQVGKGSKFYFILRESLLDIIETEEHSFLSINNDDKTNKEVLLISENKSSIKLIEDYLSSYSVKVEKVDSDSVAKEKISNISYNGIILNKENIDWNIIPLIKKSSNKKTPIIISQILEEQKIGWEPEIFEFIIKDNFETEFVDVKLRAEYFYTKNFSKANLFFQNEHKLNITENILNNFEIVYQDVSISDDIDANGLILVDVESLQEKSIEICYIISSSNKSKKTPIIFVLPNEINSNLSEVLNNNLKNYVSKIHHHPMDILKVLRDRLELNKQFDSNNSIEEIENELSVTEKKSNINPTVLIVDDDNDALFTVGEYLKAMNYDAVFAHNGMECLIMLNHVNPDLILLDIMMPQMDGFETIKRIRNDNRFLKLPIIALTAYAMLENKDVIEKNGFNDIITKPINYQTFQQTITKYIS